MAFLPERNFFEETLVTGYNLSSGVADWTSSDVSRYISFSIQVEHTSILGTTVLLVEQSVDGTTWDTLTNSTVTIPNGTGSFTLERSVFTGKNIRVRLTFADQGTLTIKTIYKR